ncbi:MAG TPA: right-handed parallel beta-helix repeat-containing protein [Planctomycetota bacterium]|nr:right-handed parallel beta-helix repeat-containing protein [Planctomycetota bacterium]
MLAEEPPAAATVSEQAPAQPATAAAAAEDDIRAEIVPLPPVPSSKGNTSTKAAQPKTETSVKATPVQRATVSPPSALQPPEAGYATVLSGTLYDGLFELGPQQSPILIRGNLIVAEDATIIIKPGAVVHLKADPKAAKPARPDVPDPSQSAVIWMWGRLVVEGATGNPVEVANLEKTPASLLLYGSAQSRIEGVRLKNVSVTQTDGVCQWTNCEYVSSPHYALAAGAALFTHCSFRNFGGVFATYNHGPWSLLLRKNVFESCREGVVLASDPGEERLIVEQNHFLNTRGAHIRLMPFAAPPADAKKASTPDVDVFIGENWYGTAVPEEAELRLVDRRIDPSVRARLNTRPPAERPYMGVGTAVSAAVLGATLKEQQAAVQKILLAHAAAAPAKPKARPAEPAAMSRGVKQPKGK